MSSDDADSVGGGGTPILKLVLEPNRVAPSLARAAVSAFCENREISDAALARVTLLVSEVVANAVIHPDVKPPANIQLLARLEAEVIRIEVTDGGAGFVPAPRDPSRVGSGYGLFLLEKHELAGVSTAPGAIGCGSRSGPRRAQSVCRPELPDDPFQRLPRSARFVSDHRG